jgi:tricorn protease interacting factor F2/3
LRVERYDIFLDVAFRDLRFDGKVLVTLESESDIVLDSVGLDVSSVMGNGRTFEFEQKHDKLMVKGGPFRGTLQIQYRGTIPEALAGIYKAPYDSTYMITTQFEADNARRMLPCVDQPDCKAEFKLTVRIDRDLDAISNMPVESVNVEGEKKVVTFRETPRMSTYLLYLGIGKFEELKGGLGKIDVIVSTTPGKARKGAFALEVAKRAIEFYQFYFGIPYALPKVHLIGVPEFSAGAMENWGAITFRESALQIDENSDFAARKRVAEVVSHELAHQWFGNLVTMKWWNDLWLNESFATFMAYKVVDAMYPNWRMWEDFLIGETSGAMGLDSLRNTHPIEVEVKSPSDVEQIFDAITYGKGASILRMIEAYMGSDEFREGVQSYLERYKFSNATGIDLWNSLDRFSGKQVERITKEWLRKPGHPMVTARISKGKLVLRQERFLLSGEREKAIWPVPITMNVNGKSKTLLLDKEEQVIDIEALKSLKLNVDRTGFYRVYYEGPHDLVWRAGLSAPDKWGIIFDAIAFLLAGKMLFAEYLTLAKQYYDEKDYLPARELSNQLALLFVIIGPRIADVSRDFHRSQLRILENKTDENSSMMRGIIAGRLAIVDDDYASELGSRFRNYESVEPDMKEAVAIAYARACEDFDAILKRYRESATDEEKLRLLGAMMTFKNTELLSRSLELALSNEVKKQDLITMILAGTRNPNARQTVWQWITTNISDLRRIQEGTGELGQFLQYSIPIFGLGRIEEVERFFDQNRIPEAQRGIDAGLERLKIYQKLMDTMSRGT